MSVSGAWVHDIVSCLILSRLHILVFLFARCSFPVRTWGRERQKEDDGKIGKEKVKRRERTQRREYREEKREIEKRGGGVYT
jgi:hypothetical protein